MKHNFAPSPTTKVVGAVTQHRAVGPNALQERWKNAGSETRNAAPGARA